MAWIIKFFHPINRENVFSVSVQRNCQCSVKLKERNDIKGDLVAFNRSELFKFRVFP